MIAGRRIALAALTVLDARPPEIVQIAAHTGFDAVTLRIADASQQAENPLVGDTPTRAETLAALEHNGIGVLDVEVIRLHGGTDLEALKPVWESAAILGAENVLVIDNEPDEPRFVQALRDLCEQLAEYPLRAALEFMVFTDCRSIGDAMRIVAATEHPTAAVLVDPLHLARSGGDPAEVRHHVVEHPERFPYAQLCDAPAGAPDDGMKGLYREAVRSRLNPGEGELPLLELLDALPQAAPLSVETPVKALAGLPPAQRAQHAIEHTRRLLCR